MFPKPCRLPPLLTVPDPLLLQGSPGPSGPKGDRGEPVSSAGVSGTKGMEGCGDLSGEHIREGPGDQGQEPWWSSPGLIWLLGLGIKVQGIWEQS